VKAMICEMCGSNNIAKEQGEYVCRSCGCKYSAEDAKKLLVDIDGPVEVKGVSTVENDLIRGDQCLDVQDWESALGISASAIAKDATCFQAWYGCLRAMSKDFQANQPVAGDSSSRICLSAAIQNSLKFADEASRETALSKLESWKNMLQIKHNKNKENEQRLARLQSKGEIARVIMFIAVVGAFLGFIIWMGPFTKTLSFSELGNAGLFISSVSAIMVTKLVQFFTDTQIGQMNYLMQNAIDYTETLSTLSKGMQRYRSTK
jgi:hypothetical protein